MKKIFAVLSLALCGLVFLVPSANATAITMHYETTAADGGPGAGVDYWLNLTDTGSATLSIFGNDTTTSWYLGWIAFKFVPGNTAITDLDNLMLNGGPATGWALADNAPGDDPNVGVLKSNGGYGGLLNNGESAIYWEGIKDPNSNIFSGIDLSDSGLLATFAFTVDVDPAYLARLFEIQEVPFQVGMYRYKTTGNGGSFEVNRLSATLVPEPGTLALLGTALVMLGVATRKYALR